eukprot:7389730-Prymnesium_polylepis.1
MSLAASGEVVVGVVQRFIAVSNNQEQQDQTASVPKAIPTSVPSSRRDQRRYTVSIPITRYLLASLGKNAWEGGVQNAGTVAKRLKQGGTVEMGLQAWAPVERANAESSAAKHMQGSTEQPAHSGTGVTCDITSHAVTPLVECWLRAMVDAPQSPNERSIDVTVTTLLDMEPTLQHSIIEPCAEALLKRHQQLLQATEGVETAVFDDAIAISIRKSFSRILGLSMESIEGFRSNLMPLLLRADLSPGAALAETAHELAQQAADNESGYATRCTSGQLLPSDVAFERKVLALVLLFVERPATLTGFQNLVPKIFDVYLAKGTALRRELCTLLEGMKLFCGDLDLTEPDRLIAHIEEALVQQPAIVV